MKYTRVDLTLLLLEAFVALTSLMCGIGLMMGIVPFPLGWLVGTPFSDYTVPGLIMAVVVGGSSLLAAALILTKQTGGIAASIAAALLLMGFEVAEVTLLDRNLGNWLPLTVVLQSLYSVLSLTIFGLAVFLWRTERSQRHMPTKHISQA